MVRKSWSKAFLFAAVVCGSQGYAIADDNASERRDEVHSKFPGGHVLWGTQRPDPASAEAEAVLQTADILRWGLEHRGAKFTKGDLVLSHITVSHWKEIKVFGKKVRVAYPNTYWGYVAFK